MSFGKAFFSSCLGALVALFVFVLLIFVFFSLLISGLSSEKEVVVAENSVLHLKLNGQFTELQQENPFEGLPLPGADVENIGLLNLKQTLEHAKSDDKIKGIYLDVSFPMTGYASLQEIRESILDFRKSGKWVIAYGEVFSEAGYYLATAADQIFINPEGEIEFNGLTVEIGFYKKLLDKLEIRPEVFRVGEFKSAVEPFLLEKMSAENRLQLTELVNSIYDEVLAGIAESRKVEKSRLKEISDKMLVKNAQTALEMGLIDSLMYIDQFQSHVMKRLNVDEVKDINFIKYSKYRKSFSTYKSSKNEIAVIVAEGTIMPGRNEDNSQIIAAENFVEEIRKAREDDEIKAVVLRVNSPGGEFKASDMIWREIQLTKSKKPVIASMSDYAASGGYYLSMGCDTIVAQPQTITGSIGIFGVMFDMSGFLGNKLGITFDEVKTGEFGELYTVTRPLNDAEKNFLQKNLEDHYVTFTTKAAEGRDVAVEDIQKVASGRVWSGAQAKERKLVDVLGGFNDAVKIAARRANVGEDYKVRFYPKQQDFFQKFLNNAEENSRAKVAQEELGELYQWYNQFKKVKTYQGSQARMPFELQIH